MADPSQALQLNPVQAGIGATLGAAQFATNLINSIKAKKEAKILARSRPIRETNPLITQNLSLAESELAGGMSPAAMKVYTDQLDKAQAGSIEAILKGGGSVNNIGDVFASGEEGRSRLALISDQLRLNQIQNVMNARLVSAEDAEKNFFYNKGKRWEDEAAANAEARKAATAGIWSGLSTMAGGVMSALSNKTGGNNVGGNNIPGVGNNTVDSTSAYGGMRRPQPNVSVPNFSTAPQPTNPQNTQQQGGYNLPDYMNDPLWWQGAHNMFNNG